MKKTNRGQYEYVLQWQQSYTTGVQLSENVFQIEWKTMENVWDDIKSDAKAIKKFYALNFNIKSQKNHMLIKRKVLATTNLTL